MHLLSFFARVQGGGGVLEPLHRGSCQMAAVPPVVPVVLVVCRWCRWWRRCPGCVARWVGSGSEPVLTSLSTDNPDAGDGLHWSFPDGSV